MNKKDLNKVGVLIVVIGLHKPFTLDPTVDMGKEIIKDELEKIAGHLLYTIKDECGIDKIKFWSLEKQ